MVMDFVEGGSVTQSMTGEDGTVQPLAEETARKQVMGSCLFFKRHRCF